MKTLRVAEVTSLTLLARRCIACQHLNILGFWNQLQPVVDHEKRQARVSVSCKKCGQKQSTERNA